MAEKTGNQIGDNRGDEIDVRKRISRVHFSSYVLPSRAFVHFQNRPSAQNRKTKSSGIHVMDY
jgi:hypothetical protein